MRVGDKVRVLRHRNFHGDNVGSLEKGRIVILKKVTDQVRQVPDFTLYETVCGWLVRSDDVEPVTEGPIRTVTRREIVPGVYGRVEVSDAQDAFNVDLEEACIKWEERVGVKFTHAALTAEELREASHMLAQIAEVLGDA